MKFSANLGFLWNDLLLPDAIRAAAAAGFDAVECHWPYDISAAEVKAALDETGLPMLGLNTIRGKCRGRRERPLGPAGARGRCPRPVHDELDVMRSLAFGIGPDSVVASDNY